MQASRNITAAIMTMIAMACVSLVDNFVVEVSQSHGLWQFQVMRTCVAVPVLIVAAMMMKQSLRPKRPVKLVLRCLAIATGLVVYFSTLGALPVAQAGAGLFSAPIWVLLLSMLLFGHKITFWQAFTILGGFVGVLLLLQPDMSALSVLSLVPLVAGVFYGLGSLLTRYWCADETPMLLAVGVFVALGGLSVFPLTWMTFWPANDTPDFLTRGWEPLTAHFLWLTLLQALGAIIAMPLIAQAYRIGIPAYVAVFEYSFLAFAGLWGLLFWGQGLNTQAWAGILMITVSGLIMSMLQDRDG